MARRLPRSFFDRSVHDVARELIGCTLTVHGCGGVIVETESYAEDDPACHAYNGMTERNRRLFGPPATAYVYRSYGIHNLLNFVVDAEGRAAAVLIRALEPTVGLEAMTERRGDRFEADLCSGPGKLTQALGIDLTDDGSDLLCDPFRVCAATNRGDAIEVVAGPRIGISKATELPWRYCLAGSRYVSRPRPLPT